MVLLAQPVQGSMVANGGNGTNVKVTISYDGTFVRITNIAIDICIHRTGTFIIM